VWAGSGVTLKACRALVVEVYDLIHAGHRAKHCRGFFRHSSRF
jgi:hypothetical protein